METSWPAFLRMLLHEITREDMPDRIASQLQFLALKAHANMCPIMPMYANMCPMPLYANMCACCYGGATAARTDVGSPCIPARVCLERKELCGIVHDPVCDKPTVSHPDREEKSHSETKNKNAPSLVRLNKA